MEADLPKYDRISSILRFTRDKKSAENFQLQLNENSLLNHRLRHGLLINEYSTPVLEQPYLECAVVFNSQENMMLCIFFTEYSSKLH